MLILDVSTGSDDSNILELNAYIKQTAKNIHQYNYAYEVRKISKI